MPSGSGTALLERSTLDESASCEGASGQSKHHIGG